MLYEVNLKVSFVCNEKITQRALKRAIEHSLLFVSVGDNKISDVKVNQVVKHSSS